MSSRRFYHVSLFYACVYVILSKFCGGFADWMTKDYCSRTMNPGDVLMNADVFLSSDRTVRVFRGDVELLPSRNNESVLYYNAGESLSIRVSDSKPQYVYETSKPATFEGGGCQGLRLANKPKATLLIPPDASQNISIRVAWAPGHGTVNVSPYLMLQPSTPNNEDREEGIDARRKSLLNNIFVSKEELLSSPSDGDKVQPISHKINNVDYDERDRRRKKHRAQMLRAPNKNLLRTRDHYLSSKDSQTEETEQDQEHSSDPSQPRKAGRGGMKDHSHSHKRSRHHVEEDPIVVVSQKNNSNQMYWDWLARVLMGLGGIFALTISCGSLMAIWHSRFAIWRSLKRTAGMDVTEE